MDEKRSDKGNMSSSIEEPLEELLKDAPCPPPSSSGVYISSLLTSNVHLSLYNCITCLDALRGKEERKERGIGWTPVGHLYYSTSI